MLSSVKDKRKASIVLVIFRIPHQIFKHNCSERQLGILFEKTDWQLKVLLMF